MKAKDENWIYDARNMTLLELANLVKDGFRMDGPVVMQLKAVLAMNTLNVLYARAESSFASMRGILEAMATQDMRETGNELQLRKDFEIEDHDFNRISYNIGMLVPFMESPSDKPGVLPEGSSLPDFNIEQKGDAQ